MSDLNLSSSVSVAESRVRTRRVRPRLATESGADLLQPSSRVTHNEAQILAQARAILLRLSAYRGTSLTAPRAVRDYLVMLLATQERELFTMVALDNRHRVIASEILFAGTIDGSSVHPREVVKSALRYNAAAVIRRVRMQPCGCILP